MGHNGIHEKEYLFSLGGSSPDSEGWGAGSDLGSDLDSDERSSLGCKI